MVTFQKCEAIKMVVAALNFYYDGLSLEKHNRNIEQIFGEKVSQVTILNWIRNTHY